MSSTVLEIVQIEIHTTNLEKSILFYSNVFGWKPLPAEIQNCVVLDVPENSPWGVSLIPTKAAVTPNKSFTLYFKTSNAESLAKLAKEFGGASLFGPTLLPAYGSIWQITDPDGHRFGLFQP